MWKPDICVHHGDCDDGFGAAWAIWHKWPDCQFVPGYYGKPIGVDVAGMNVLMVDFSFKRPEIEALANEAKSIVIIDHHKTAEAELAPYRVDVLDRGMIDAGDVEALLGYGGDPRVVAWFDMNQSGAPMALKFAFPDATVPEMLKLIEDRDLWRFQYGDRTRQFSAALRTYPHDFAVWDDLAVNVERLVQEGEIVLRAHRANLAKIAKEMYWANICGYRVPVVNAPYHYASDVAHELLQQHKDAPFAAAWFRRGDGKTQYSLRSEDHRIDVSMVAAKLGGGGHRNAAGFQG